jgi:hypothetical protein
MAESVMIVCDVCGKPAEESVIIKVGGANLAKDLCAAHLRELVSGTHKPKRGRKPGATSGTATATTPRRRGRPKGTTRKTSARRTRKRRKVSAAT